MQTSLLNAPTRLANAMKRSGKGILVAVVLGLAARFLSDHYGAPAMLMALLLGIAFHFLAEDEGCRPGIEFAARTVLRFGVALLGVRVSAGMLAGLGWELIALVIAGVFLTVLSGLLGARFLGRGWRLGVLTGGSVAICGASAAMAIAAVLPRNAQSERNLTFTVLSVTVLSTMAMVLYPVFVTVLELPSETAGVYLGATIHDVAQVVGAGFSLNQETGEVATMVKLMRVTLLAPVVLGLSIAVRRMQAGNGPAAVRPPLLPVFVTCFILLAGVNTFGLIPHATSEICADLSGWALLISVAAVGMKTSLKRILEVGGQAVFLVIAETVFLAAIILVGVLYLR